MPYPRKIKGFKVINPTFKKGGEYLCIKSVSDIYEVGCVYMCVEHNGNLYLVDGLCELCYVNHIGSSFQEVL